MSSKMTPEAKARLREIAAAKKGRDTLQGMDQTTGRVGFDWVMDQQASGPLPEVQVQKYGYVEYREPGKSVWEDVTDEDTLPTRIAYWRLRSESKNPSVPWVRLKQCPQWVFDEFASRWTVRKIAFQSHKGPEMGTEWETITVVPIDIAVAWFRFLWPEEEHWGRRVKKYFTGFTERWIQMYPGVGAKINLVTFHDYPELNGINSQISHLDASGTSYFSDPGTEYKHLGHALTRNHDKWEVVG